MMLEIPIKYKEVKRGKYGSAHGGFYTNAVLIIGHETMKFEHKNYKILKYFFNQLPVQFIKNQNKVAKFYKNQFDEYKVYYSMSMQTCEITFKSSPEYHKIIDDFIKQWHV